MLRNINVHSKNYGKNVIVTWYILNLLNNNYLRNKNTLVYRWERASTEKYLHRKWGYLSLSDENICDLGLCWVTDEWIKTVIKLAPPPLFVLSILRNTLVKLKCFLTQKLEMSMCSSTTKYDFRYIYKACSASFEK